MEEVAEQATAAAVSFEADMEKAKECMLQGEHEEATEYLEPLLEARVGEYGQLASENAELYLLYGEALLNVGRAREADVLTQLVAEQMEQQQQQRESAASGGEAAAGPAQSEAEIRAKLIAAGTASASAAGEEAEGEDIETFELAWQWLEVARLIYAKELQAAPASRRLQERLAQVFDLLGQLGMEIENDGQYVKDLEEALRMRTALLPGIDRKLVAESHMHVGTAKLVSNDAEAALQQYHRSSLILEELSGQQGVLELKNELNRKIIEAQRVASHLDKEEPSSAGKITELVRQQFGLPASPARPTGGAAAAPSPAQSPFKQPTMGDKPVTVLTPVRKKRPREASPLTPQQGTTKKARPDDESK